LSILAGANDYMHTQPIRALQEPAMPLKLYAHPFSSYCQKVLITLYENDTPFEFRMLAMNDAEATTELEGLWPFKKFPVLTDGDHSIKEASIIVEYLDLHYPGRTRMIPADPKAALEVRFMDRFFDNYVMTPQGKLVFDLIRSEENRDRQGVTEAKQTLDISYKWLDGVMKDRRWATGDVFTLADCAAAPALFYADWSYPIDEEFTHVHAYRQRLLAHPAFARAVDEARPFRKFFPGGAPERD
jgi:glutathione S-transferase